MANYFTVYTESHGGMQVQYIKRMRDLREDHDMTQQQVANYLGISQTMYARYERGANELPIRHLLALADLYEVTTDYILCRIDVLEIKKEKEE